MLSPETTASLDAHPLPGEAWLQDRRRAALDRAESLGLPSAEEEVWRYTPIGDLDVGAFTPADSPGDASSGPLADAAANGAAVVVTFVDGHLVDISGSADGVTVERLSEASDDAGVLGAAIGGSGDVFADLSLGLSREPIAVRIARGAVVESPVVIRHELTAPESLTCSRVVVAAGENSEATVVEVFDSAEVFDSSNKGALVLPVTELVVEQAARLRYMSVQTFGSSVWQIGTQSATIERDAHLLTGTVALGGDYARVRTDTRMVGRGAEGDIIAVYFGDGDQTLDFRTFQQHVAPDTQSNLLFKGALDDAARSIYTGLIRIEKDATGVDAHQTNRNIKLSDDAWAESVPNLEIENNDVKCSHASAVGPIDEEQRFYLESRGVPTEVAERLVVQGFFNEVLSQLPHLGLAAAVEAELTARLQGGASS